MDVWDSILQFTGKLLSPDWGGLVLLIPFAVLVLVAGYMAWVFRRFASAGPALSRPLPTAPPPRGMHMPGPSLAPFLVAIGAFAFLLSTLFISIQTAVDPATKQPVPGSTTIVIEPGGVVALVVGLLAMVGALLYWGREARREYDALEPPAGRAAAVPAVAALPAGGHASPPAGVHVPGPSFRPLLVSIAAAALVLGLAIAPIVAAAGLVMLVIALLGWLGDARREYRLVVKADSTGHLENIPAPRFPVGTLIVFAVLFIGSLLLAGMTNAPGGGTTAGAGGGSASPAPASPAASTAPGSPVPSPASTAPATPALTPAATASAAPAASQAATPAASLPPPSATPAPSGAGAPDLKIAAKDLAYDVSALEVQANTPFTIEFTNGDDATPHNVSIRQGSLTAASIFQGEIFEGVGTRTYQVQALPAGAYFFVCSVHSFMSGTLTVK